MPHWAIEAALLDRLRHQLDRAMSSDDGVTDAEALKLVGRTIALLAALDTENLEYQARVQQTRQNLDNAVVGALRRLQEYDRPADPAVVLALTEALALAHGALEP
jgi:hypothetical protein